MLNNEDIQKLKEIRKKADRFIQKVDEQLAPHKIYCCVFFYPEPVEIAYEGMESRWEAYSLAELCEFYFEHQDKNEILNQEHLWMRDWDTYQVKLNIDRIGSEIDQRLFRLAMDGDLEKYFTIYSYSVSKGIHLREEDKNIFSKALKLIPEDCLSAFLERWGYSIDLGYNGTGVIEETLDSLCRKGILRKFERKVKGEMQVYYRLQDEKMTIRTILEKLKR